MLDATKTTKVIEQELQTLKAQIIANMRAANEVASGRTIRSMAVVVAPDGLSVSLVGRSPFGTLETGRKGGRIPRNFDQIIYDWMQAKGIHAMPMPYKRNNRGGWSPQERGDWSMARAIAHTIQTSGTKLFREGGRTDIYSNAIPQAMERISKRLNVLYDAELTENIMQRQKDYYENLEVEL